jgi:hypothetical protein
LLARLSRSSLSQCLSLQQIDSRFVVVKVCRAFAIMIYEYYDSDAAGAYFLNFSGEEKLEICFIRSL